MTPRELSKPVRICSLTASQVLYLVQSRPQNLQLMERNPESCVCMNRFHIFMDNQHTTSTAGCYDLLAATTFWPYDLWPSAGCINSSYTTHVVQYSNSVRMECVVYDSYRWWQSEDGCRRFSPYSPCDGRQLCMVRIDESRGRYLYYCCTENVAELNSTTRKTCFEIDSKSDRFVLSMYLGLIPRWPGNEAKVLVSVNELASFPGLHHCPFLRL